MSPTLRPFPQGLPFQAAWRGPLILVLGISLLFPRRAPPPDHSRVAAQALENDNGRFPDRPSKDAHEFHDIDVDNPAAAFARRERFP